MKKFKSMVSEVYLAETYRKATKAKLRTSEDTTQYLRNVWSNDLGVRESFYALFLNRANNTVGWSVISTGGVTGTVVDVKMIAQLSVAQLACAVIVSHNHPSGNIQPSEADINITKKIETALKYFEIQLLDHIILTTESYLSFADEGLIK